MWCGSMPLARVAARGRQRPASLGKGGCQGGAPLRPSELAALGEAGSPAVMETHSGQGPWGGSGRGAQWSGKLLEIPGWDSIRVSLSAPSQGTVSGPP